MEISAIAKGYTSWASLQGGLRVQDSIGKSSLFNYSVDLTAGYMNNDAIEILYTPPPYEGIPVVYGIALGAKVKQLSLFVGGGVRYTYMIAGQLSNEQWKEYRDNPNSVYAGGQVLYFKENDFRLFNNLRLSYRLFDKFQVDLDYIIYYYEQPHGVEGIFILRDLALTLNYVISG